MLSYQGILGSTSLSLINPRFAGGTPLTTLQLIHLFKKRLPFGGISISNIIILHII